MPNYSFRVGYRPGVLHTAHPSGLFDTILGLTQQAEALDFDGVFIGDRLLASVERKGQRMYDFTCAELFVTLAAMAARTTKIGIGPLVAVVPFRNPVQLAKITASLDLLSNGRLLLGVGAGWNEKEMALFGFEKNQAARRMEESLEIMQKLWTGQPISYQGKYFQYEGIAVEPTPARPGGPPLWFGSWLPFRHGFGQGGEVSPNWNRMLARVGRLGDCYVPLVYSIVVKRSVEAEILGYAWERVQEHAAAAGRAGKLEFAFSHHYYAIKTKEDEENAREDLSHFAGTFEEAKSTYMVGSPEEIVEKIRNMTSRLDRVDWYIFSALGMRPRQLDLLHQEILPLLAESHASRFGR